MTGPDPEELLANAIRAHADSIPGDADSEQYQLLDSFAVIACWAPTTDSGSHRYSLHYDRPSVPTHVALGLFDQALQMIAAEDDDEA